MYKSIFISSFIIMTLLLLLLYINILLCNLTEYPDNTTLI